MRLHGFSIEISAIPLDHFITALAPISGVEDKYRGEHRIIYVSSNDDYYLLLILTAKDQKRFCALAKSEKKFKITVLELKDDNRMADFNFAIINKATGRGVYQHYRGSCSLTTFGHILHGQYADEMTRRRDADLKEIGDEEKGRTKKRRAVVQKYKDSLTVNPMYKKDDFDKLVSKLLKIQNLSFDYTTLSAGELKFKPSSKLVRKERHTLLFEPQAGKAKILAGIRSVISRMKSKLGNISVGGLDPTTESFVTYNLFDNLETFAQFDFDQVMADKSALMVPDFEQSSFFDKMLTVARSHAMWFEGEAE